MIIFEIFNQFPSEFPLLKTLLCAVIGYVLGIVWYHPKINSDYHNHAEYNPNASIYVIAACLWLVTAGVYSFIVGFLTPPMMPALLGLSTFLWVGFVLPPVLLNGLFKSKPLMVMATDSSYYLAAFYLFAVIHDVI